MSWVEYGGMIRSCEHSCSLSSALELISFFSDWTFRVSVVQSEASFHRDFMLYTIIMTRSYCFVNV